MATVVVPGSYVPRPPDEIGWVGKPTRSAFYLLTSVQLYAPMGPRVFTPGDTSSEVWYRRPQSNFNLLLGAIPPAAMPFRPHFNMGYDVNAPVWTGRPHGNNTLFLAFAAIPTFFGAKGQSQPKRWAFDYTAEAVWAFHPPRGFTVNQPPPPAQNTAKRSTVTVSIIMGIG